MGRRILRWIGILLGGLALLAVLAFATLFVVAEQRLTRRYPLPGARLTIPTGPAAIARGRHRAGVACQGCHGADLAGGVVLDDPQLGHVEAPNLTRGAGGAGSALSDADFVRAVRYGLAPDGRALIAMPAAAFYYFSDDDLGAVIAYVRSVPPVDRPSRPSGLAPLGHVLLATGAFGTLLSAEAIDPDRPRPTAPAPGVTAAYGEYVVNVSDCRACHGQQLAGGKSPIPNSPPVPDLTPGGELAGWSEQDFITTLRTGRTPTRRLTDFMPWKEMGRLDDDELRAVWLYLRSLPAHPPE